MKWEYEIVMEHDAALIAELRAALVVLADRLESYQAHAYFGVPTMGTDFDRITKQIVTNTRALIDKATP